MSDAIALLEMDHVNSSKVLDVVQEQVTNIAQGAPVNYGLIESAVAYMSEYLDQCHHPKEELVYRKLLSRCPDMKESLVSLIGDHEELARLTGQLSQAMGEPRQDRVGLNERLVSQLKEFLEYYRRHMIMEEEYFFPAARQMLSRDDFAAIDFALFDQADPLFNRATEERFVELRDEILRLGGNPNGGADIREESAWLANLRDVATFNEAMKQFDKSILLTHSSNGGYDLERDGKVMVHIPECKESRAAWCAYFFWKGVAKAQGIVNFASLPAGRVRPRNYL